MIILAFSGPIQVKVLLLGFLEVDGLSELAGGIPHGRLVEAWFRRRSEIDAFGRPEMMVPGCDARAKARVSDQRVLSIASSSVVPW
jgi:hypothetical protein